GRVVVVVKRMAVMSVDPLAAAGARPGAEHAVAGGRGWVVAARDFEDGTARVASGGDAVAERALGKRRGVRGAIRNISHFRRRLGKDTVPLRDFEKRHGIARAIELGAGAVAGDVIAAVVGRRNLAVGRIAGANK